MSTDASTKSPSPSVLEAWAKSTRARDTGLNRTVAIKVLPSHFSDNPEMKARFDREAQTIAGLNHPRQPPTATSLSQFHFGASIDTVRLT